MRFRLAVVALLLPMFHAALLPDQTGVAALPEAVKDASRGVIPGASWQPIPLLPGARVIDVTQPPYNAKPNDGSDDTTAIQAALNAAGQWPRGTGIAQQIVYLPPGEYLVSDTLAFPKHSLTGKSAPQEMYTWLWGAGADQTVIRLRASSDSGKTLGTAQNPRPVVQAAEYRFDWKNPGNTNFQLFVTDLAIVVPSDQPHAVGLSYGSANMGAVRNVRITAEGRGGHTGLALVQYNNGPGYIERVHITGFAIGLEINDPWGELFTFRDITVERQKAGGTGVSITDKLIAIENLSVVEDQPDVVAIRLFDDRSRNSRFGGVPYLNLIRGRISNTAPGGARVPAVKIGPGHLYLRDVVIRGYGDSILEDHGLTRSFPRGRIDEFISIHGRTVGEKPNVAVTVGGAPPKSLGLEVRPAPEAPVAAWAALRRGDWRRVAARDLSQSPLRIKTSWVLVDPSACTDHTALLQAALDSGARYIGLLNHEPFRISRTLVVNGSGTPRNTELIYGLMSEINVEPSLSARKPPYSNRHDGLLMQFETGRHARLHLKGIRITARNMDEGGGRERADQDAADFQLFENRAAGAVVFEDIRSKTGPRHYRNSGASLGGDVFIENVEWAYNGAFPDVPVVFVRQNVWARNHNLEMNITEPDVTLHVNGTPVRFLRFSFVPRLVNNGGRLWSFGQKVGEMNGVFVETRAGGRTELLSLFLNQACPKEFGSPRPDAVPLVVKEDVSAMSFVGQERPRDRNPHADVFARFDLSSGTVVVKGTSLPTYLRYAGFDPFADNDPERYAAENTFRVVGVLRYGCDPPRARRR